MHKELAKSLGIESYRKIPTLSLSVEERKRENVDSVDALKPGWLNGEDNTAVQLMDDGMTTAQVTPFEYTTKVFEKRGIS